jgi:acyl carrier protein
MNTQEMKAAIEASLRKFWGKQSIAVDQASEAMGDLIDPLDSLSAIDALLDIQKIVDIEIPEEKVIRPGGYNSEEHFVEDLTGRILNYIEGQKK